MDFLSVFLMCTTQYTIVQQFALLCPPGAFNPWRTRGQHPWQPLGALSLYPFLSFCVRKTIGEGDGLLYQRNPELLHALPHVETAPHTAPLQHSTVQYRTVPYSTVRYSALLSPAWCTVLRPAVPQPWPLTGEVL